jgi:hypothetical protein
LPGAEGCIAQAELAELIEVRMRRAVFVRPADALLLVEGRIGPTAAGGFEAVIAFSDPAGTLLGERVLPLEGAHCRAVDDMVALVIAVTLRGSASGVPLPPEISAQLEALFGDEPSTLDPSTLPASAPQPAAAAAAPREPAVRAPIPSERHEPPDVALGLDVAMAVATGLQPSGSLAPAAQLRFAFRELAVLYAGAGLDLPQQTTVTDGMDDGRLELRAWHAAVLACGVIARPFRGGLELCARFALGRLRADPADFEWNYPAQTQTWSELGPELNARAPLAWRLYGRVGLGMPVRLSRPRFVYQRSNNEEASAFEVDGVGFRGELALGLSLP